MNVAQLFQLEVESTSATWRVARVQGREQLDAPFSFVVIAEPLADDTTLTRGLRLDDLVTKKATLSWSTDAGERAVSGVVEAVSRAEMHYEITLVPAIALLEQTVDHQVFIQKDAVEIVTEVLKAHEIQLDARVARSLPKRQHCVQLFESDLAFVARLLAEEGITWFMSHETRGAIVLTDHAKGFDRMEGDLPVLEDSGMVTERSVYEARVRRAVVTDKVSLRDYDHLAPQLDLKAAAHAKREDLETYEYPGAFKDAGLGKALAGIRLEERRAKELVLEAESSARDLAPGLIVTLRSDVATFDGEWLIFEVTHLGQDQAAHVEDRRYRARFKAIPAATTYRPARSPAPRAGGVEHAVTTGPAGQEIHTDPHARVRTLFRWDRVSKANEGSSAWIRTAQPPTSGGFFLPRVGWEVLVGFAGTSLDSPVVLGRLYNGQAQPPNALPANKIVSAFGTLTTPGGGSANLVAMNDTAGSEGLTFNASSDLNERTENDKVTGVSGSATANVGGNRQLIVGQVHELGVGGAQTHAVGGSRNLTVSANVTIAAGAETVTIGGTRKQTIGGDLMTGCSTLTRVVGGARAELDIEHETREVGGAQTVLVGGSWNQLAAAGASVAVAGASTELVGGAKKVAAGKYYLGVTGALNFTVGSWSVAAGASHDMGFNGGASFVFAGGADMKGADVVFKADSSLTVKASGITISITPGSVKISGQFDGGVASMEQGDESYA